MDLNDTNAIVTLLCGIALIVGTLGVIVPVLPGLVLCWAGVAAWALLADANWGRWVVLALATVLALAGTVVKYTWPSRSLKRTGVPNKSLFVGGVLGLVGFFVVPVVGLVLGFVLGVFLAERVRLSDGKLARASTRQALKAAGLGMLIELAAALSIALVWGIGLILT